MSDNLYKDKARGYFESVRPEMLEFLPQQFERVLDVGCGNGAFGQAIKNQHPKTEVWGVEYDLQAAEEAKSVLEKSFGGPIEAHLTHLPDNYFDCVFFNDVLEHLQNPYQLLEEIKPKLRNGGVVISSIPNIRYFRTFSRLIFHKEWEYAHHGVLDFTHLRFFTVKSIRKMYEGAGYEVITHKGIRRTKSIRPKLLNIVTLGWFWDIEYTQFATVARVI